jgi:hypothetical protein
MSRKNNYYDDRVIGHHFTAASLVGFVVGILRIGTSQTYFRFCHLSPEIPGLVVVAVCLPWILKMSNGKPLSEYNTTRGMLFISPLCLNFPMPHQQTEKVI